MDRKDIIDTNNVSIFNLTAKKIKIKCYGYGYGSEHRKLNLVLK
jgi:hypothetical protein